MEEFQLHTDSTLEVQFTNVGGLDSGTTSSFSTSGVASVNASNTISINMKGGLIQHKTFNASTGLSECNALVRKLLNGMGIFSLTLTESYSYMYTEVTNKYACLPQNSNGTISYTCITNGGDIIIIDSLNSKQERVTGLASKVTKTYQLSIDYMMFNEN